MTIDITAAAGFMAGHARQLDRRRFALLTGTGEPAAVLAALEGYRNPDGGYGWGLEPDLRSASSQPGGALHALEALAELPPAPQALALCDWLATATLPDGGLPFASPVPDPAACAPFWASADPGTSSLQITACVAATAHRVAAHDPAVAAHPWLATATAYCLDAARAVDAGTHALELAFTLHLLDAVHDTEPAAPALLDRLGALIPADGLLPVAGGSDGEALRPLDVAPEPGRPVRALFTAEAVAADLDRLACGQQPDGGWAVDYASYSPAAALEWRGHRTVWVLSTLRSNGMS
ncbi:hypothetical protein [Pseudonocardia sp. GCM10023141]|uniref:hypothetical protein n=1 Tax=Pseudonocardia sp. GCM10023141 TaxID=3252653 RepID=UPI003611C00B